jgi:hypothetical protein
MRMCELLVVLMHPALPHPCDAAVPSTHVKYGAAAHAFQAAADAWQLAGKCASTAHRGAVGGGGGWVLCSPFRSVAESTACALLGRLVTRGAVGSGGGLLGGMDLVLGRVLDARCQHARHALAAVFRGVWIGRTNGETALS